MPPEKSTSSTLPVSPFVETARAIAAPWLRQVAQAALALLALALPFELVQPLASVGPLELTSAELFLYLALALSAAAIALEVLPDWKRVSWRQLAVRHAGVALFAIVLVLSAARAPLGRPEAIKFALRNVGGIALYVAAANLLRAPTAALTTTVAMTIGAVVASSLMWAELHLPGAAAALRRFHPGTFDVFGLPRASGPFQYPNIAAMYLEAALPVALAAGVGIGVHKRSRSRTAAILTALAALVIVEGLTLTASRAALVTAGVVLAALSAHGLRRKTPERWLAPAVLVMVGLFALMNTAVGSLAGLRLKFWNDAVWYRSVIAPAGDVPTALGPWKDAIIDMDVRNAGVRPWPAVGPHRVTLSYHWRNETTGAMVIYDGFRTDLPRDIAPGETIRLPAHIHSPAQLGRYRLHMELVHEGITWFGEQGDIGYDTIIEVRMLTAPAPLRPAALAAVPVRSDSLADRPSRIQLWGAAVMAWRDYPLLGLGPDNFRHVYDRYLGLKHNPDERLHANNLYFETLASMGLAGVVALALVIVGLAGAARRALRRHGAASPAGLVAAAATAGLLAYLAHGFFDYFLEFTPTYALLWLLAGMLAGLASEKAAAT